tara:strand:- start:1054 stop:1830 length:777 start_codon:yes stop_codon:yes gene_type:complete
MGVDGGAGNAISLSEIQSFYGGSNPISLSEYYRNGSLVPGDQVAAQSNTSGTTSQSIGDFTVTVSGTFNGTLSGFSDTISNGNTISFTVAANTALVQLGTQHPDKDGGSSTVTYTVNVGGTSISVTSEDGTGNGAFVNDGFFQGPSAFGATGSGTDRGDLTAGTTVSLARSGVRIRQKSRAGTSDVVFTNNNAITLTTTSGSTGGAQTYTQSQSRTVKDDSSTPDYTLGYDAVLGNTNVPASGTINMNVFNAPGNATP